MKDIQAVQSELRKMEEEWKKINEEKKLLDQEKKELERDTCKINQTELEQESKTLEIVSGLGMFMLYCAYFIILINGL